MTFRNKHTIRKSLNLCFTISYLERQGISLTSLIAVCSRKSLFTASQPIPYDLHAKLSYTIHPVPFLAYEITNTNPSHPIQKNQHKNTVPTSKKNIRHRRILATHNRRHRTRRNQNPSPKKRNTRRNRNQKRHQNHKERPLLRVLGLLQTRSPPASHKRTRIRSRNPTKRENHNQLGTH